MIAAGSAPLGEDLLLLVDFKWLMVGIGWWVDLTRWRGDGAYAHQCLERAMESNSAVLRACACDVLARCLPVGGVTAFSCRP